MNWMEIVNQVIVAVLPVLQTTIVGVVIWLLTVSVKWINKKVDVLSEEKEALIEAKVLAALEVGVTVVTETVVKEIKAKAADGKLTADEAKAASMEALKVAKDLLMDKGVDLFKEYKDEALDALVSFMVEKLKLKKNV